MKTLSQLLLTFLLNACWQVPLVTAFAASGAWLLGHSTARYRHLLWVAALWLGLLLPAFVASRVLTERLAVDKCREAVATDRVRVLCSASVPLPITIGFFNPVIVLPAGLLREGNADLLTSAIGHEFMHVARRDYLFNLIYEIVFLPLSFHPAATILRRRIKQTRELSCDELVAESVLDREVYARALVRLAGSALPLRRLSVNTTVGIADADILEVRIMSLLKPNLLARRKALLVAASLLLALPSVGAAAYGLRFGLQAPARLTSLQEPAASQERNQERERKLRLVFRTEPEYTADALAARIEGTVQLSAMIGPDGSVQDVQVTKSLYPSLDESAATGLRRWRFEPYVKDGQPTSKRIAIEVVFNLKAWEMQQQRKAEELGARDRGERDGRLVNWAITDESGKTVSLNTARVMRADGQEIETLIPDRDDRMRREREARDTMAAGQAELAKVARITMDQAIQIARGQNPGTVLECSLVGEHWEAPGRLGKASQVLYHVVILSGNNLDTTHVMVNAVDGRIVTVNLEGRERNE